jgi:hypothetical protein
MGSNPSVRHMPKPHHSGNFRQPRQRLRPPDFACHGHNGIGSAKLRSVREQESQFTQNLFVTQA